MDRSQYPNQMISSKSSDNDILKYLFAACIFGTALGNMFVSSKFKSYRTVSVPFVNKSTSSKTKSKKHDQTENYYDYDEEIRKRSAEELRHKERIRNYNFQREEAERIKRQYDNWSNKHRRGVQIGNELYPHRVVNALKVLQIHPEIHPLTKDQVKSAFHNMATLYHPDKLLASPTTRLESNALKQEYETKFNEVNSAYQELLIYINDKHQV